MSNCSLKTGISACNLQIGIADSRKRHAHDGFTIADRLCHISDLQFAILVTQSLHVNLPVVRSQLSLAKQFQLTTDNRPHSKLLRFLVNILGRKFYSLSLAANVDRQTPLETFSIRHFRRGADPPIPGG